MPPPLRDRTWCRGAACEMFRRAARQARPLKRPLHPLHQQCRLSDEVKEIHDWFDYQSVVNARTTDKHHGLFHHSSETHWFKAVNTITSERDSVMIRHTITCSSYKLQAASRPWRMSGRA